MRNKQQQGPWKERTAKSYTAWPQLWAGRLVRVGSARLSVPRTVISIQSRSLLRSIGGRQAFSAPVARALTLPFSSVTEFVGHVVAFISLVVVYILHNRNCEARGD